MSLFENLTMPMLDLLGAYINISRNDKDMLLEHQAKLLAIHWRQKESPDFGEKDLRKPPRFGKDNELAMKSMMTRLSVSEADLSNARKAVISRVGMPPEVPPIGKIAVDMEVIDAPLLDTLIVIQTGIYMLRTAERIAAFSSGNEAGRIDDLMAMLVEQTDVGQFARSFIGAYEDDSRATVSAQAFLHMMDLSFAFLEAKPVLAKDSSKQELSDIARSIGYQTIVTGAGMLADQGRLSDARDILMALPEAEHKVDSSMVSTLENFVKEQIISFRNEKLISDLVFEKGENLLEKRFEQADLGVILNRETEKQNLDLKERLRQKLSTAK